MPAASQSSRVRLGMLMPACLLAAAILSAQAWSQAPRSLVSVGIAANVRTFSGPGYGPETNLVVPGQTLDVALQLGKHFEIHAPTSYAWTRDETGATFSSFAIAGIATYHFRTDPDKLRPFIGAGGIYDRYDAKGVHDGRLGIHAEMGASIPIGRDVNIRPALLLERLFVDGSRAIPALKGYGASLGMYWRLPIGPTDPLASPPPAYVPAHAISSPTFRLQASFARESYSSGGVATTIDIPTPSVGALFPIANGRVAAGAELGYRRSSYSGGHSSALQFDPRIEWNVFQAFRSMPGVRVGASLAFRHEQSPFGTGTVRGSGLDAVVTFPFHSDYSFFSGVGFQRFEANPALGQSAARRLSAKIGLDHAL